MIFKLKIWLIKIKLNLIDPLRHCAMCATEFKIIGRITLQGQFTWILVELFDELNKLFMCSVPQWQEFSKLFYVWYKNWSLDLYWIHQNIYNIERKKNKNTVLQLIRSLFTLKVHKNLIYWYAINCMCRLNLSFSFKYYLSV